MKIESGPFLVRPADGGMGPDLLVCVPLEENRVPHGFTFRWLRLERTARRREPFGLPGHERADCGHLARALGLDNVATMTQVHGSSIRSVSGASFPSPVCDGMRTDRGGLGLAVKTADCVPLLLWESRGNIVAAVHAGWRGTLARIGSAAIRALAKAGSSTPESVHVVIGPAIGRCCYEVGGDVASAFGKEFPYSRELLSTGRRGCKHLDLVEANRRQLEEENVPPDQIYVADLCTACHNDVLYSYRREGKEVGRQFGVIGARR